MSIGCLPESITKDVLFKRAQERFQDWARMYGDPDISATYMYEDMSASCYCGAPQDDFPEAFKEVQLPQKTDSASCFFTYRDVTFRVTSDDTDDKEYIWCDKYKDYDELVDWTWGTFFVGTKWNVRTTEQLDKFIDLHKEE